MQQFTIVMMASAMFFIAEYSATKYIIVDIEDDLRDIPNKLGMADKVGAVDGSDEASSFAGRISTNDDKGITCPTEIDTLTILHITHAQFIIVLFRYSCFKYHYHCLV